MFCGGKLTGLRQLVDDHAVESALGPLWPTVLASSGRSEFPEMSFAFPLDKEKFDLCPCVRSALESRRKDLGVIDDQDVIGQKILNNVGKLTMLGCSVLTIQYEQS